MFKPQITGVFLFSILLLNLSPEISEAQVKKTNVSGKAWKRPVTYIMPTPRVKPRKYVYQIETRQVTRGTVGVLLPSQVAINTRSASYDGSVSLKPKAPARRTIASEGN